MSLRRKGGWALAIACLLFALAIVVGLARAAAPASQPAWQWETAQPSTELVAIGDGPARATLSAEHDGTDARSLVVTVGGHRVGSAGAAAVEEEGAITAFVVARSEGPEMILGAARADVARVLLTIAGVNSQELLLNQAHAFAVADVAPGTELRLDGLATDGSTITSIKLPRTHASCGAAVGPCGGLAANALTRVYGVTSSPSGSLTRSYLTALDQRTLRPVGRKLLLSALPSGQQIGHVALSPDGQRIAVASLHGGTLRIVDLASLQVTSSIPTRSGVDIRALGWLDDDQLAAIAQRMSKPYARQVTGRWLLRTQISKRTTGALSITNKLALATSATAGPRFIAVLRPNRLDDHRVLVVAADADNRSFIVNTRLPGRGRSEGDVRAAVSADGRHVYLVRAGGEIDDIEIATQRMTVHHVAAPAGAPTTIPQSVTLSAAAFGDGLVVSGVFRFSHNGEPAFRSGVYRVDTSNWSATTLDPNNENYTVYGSKVAVFGFTSPQIPGPSGRSGGGVSVYDTAGTQLYHVYDQQHFSIVRLIGSAGHAMAFASMPGGAGTDRRFDSGSGQSLGSGRLPLNGLRLIYRGSPDIGELGAAAAPSSHPFLRPSGRAPAHVTAAQTGPHLRAFDRPARPRDHLPARTFSHGLGPDQEKAIDSRLIAGYVDGRGRHANLYLAKTASETCLISTWNGGAGAGCDPSARFLSSDHASVTFGHLLFGVGDDRVARAVVVGTRGVRHPVDVTSDGGFIYDCKAYNGCFCVIDHVEVFDASGHLIGTPGSTGSRAGCRRTQGASATSARSPNRVVRWTNLPQARPSRIPRDVRAKARRVGVFAGHTLWVAPTRSGWCLSFSDSFGGCELRGGAPVFSTAAGEFNQWMISATESIDSALVEAGGSIHASPGHDLFVVYKDGGSAQIPITYVGAPINAGFFDFRVPAGHRAPATRVLFFELRVGARVVARLAIRAAYPVPRMTPAGPPRAVARARVLGNLWILSTYRDSSGHRCVRLRMGHGGTEQGCPLAAKPTKAVSPFWGGAGHSAKSGRAGWGRVWIYGFLTRQVSTLTLVRECATETIPRQHEAFLRVLTPAELHQGGLPRELIARDASGRVIQDIHISMHSPLHGASSARTC